MFKIEYIKDYGLSGGSRMSQDTLFLYSDLITRTWTRMVKLVGVHTVMILTKRAIWLTSQKYSEASLIKYDEDGFNLSGLLDYANPKLAKETLEEFLGSLIDILTRLVGRDVTRKLAAEIDSMFNREAMTE